MCEVNSDVHGIHGILWRRAQFQTQPRYKTALTELAKTTSLFLKDWSRFNTSLAVSTATAACCQLKRKSFQLVSQSMLSVSLILLLLWKEFSSFIQNCLNFKKAFIIYNIYYCIQINLNCIQCISYALLMEFMWVFISLQEKVKKTYTLWTPKIYLNYLLNY